MLQVSFPQAVEYPGPPADLPEVDALNRHLQNLAASERCEFCDVGARRVWNPAAMKGTVDSTGFVRPLHAKMPACDLLRTLYGYDSARGGRGGDGRNAQDRQARAPAEAVLCLNGGANLM